MNVFEEVEIRKANIRLHASLIISYLIHKQKMIVVIGKHKKMANSRFATGSEPINQCTSRKKVTFN